MTVTPGNKLEIKASDWNSIALKSRGNRGQASMSAGLNIVSDNRCLIKVLNVGERDISGNCVMMIDGTDSIVSEKDINDRIKSPFDLNNNIVMKGRLFDSEYESKISVNKIGTPPNYTKETVVDINYRPYRYFRIGITQEPIDKDTAGAVCVYGQTFAWVEQERWYKSYLEKQIDEWHKDSGGVKIYTKRKGWIKPPYTPFYGAEHKKQYLKKLELGNWHDGKIDTYSAAFGWDSETRGGAFQKTTQPVFEVIYYTGKKDKIEGHNCELAIVRFRSEVEGGLGVLLGRETVYTSHV